MAQQRGQEERGLPEGLRVAIERTFAATADSRGRAQELLDDVTRRGREARDAVARRGEGAQSAAGDAAARVVEAIEGMRLATREDIRALEKRLDVIAQRADSLAKRVAALESKPKVEG